MKVSEIEKLLAKYYDGNTTEAEEQELKQFFSREDVPTHLLAEKEFFMQTAMYAEPEIPEHLESKLSRMIDQWDTAERRTEKIKKQTRIIRLQWIGSIAAGLLILFSVGMYLYKPYSTPKDTYETPEKAYAEAQRALMMFSTSLNKGMEGIEIMQETTEKVQENVNQQLNRINNLK